MPTARPSREKKTAIATPRLLIAAPAESTNAIISRDTQQSVQSLASAPRPITSAGKIDSSGTIRKLPSHFPSTISLVESGVLKSKSRLPLARSSASDVAATTLKSKSPILT